MTRSILLAASCLAGLAACSRGSAEEALAGDAFVAATRVESARPAALPEAIVPLPPLVGEPTEPERPEPPVRERSAPVERVEAANRAATREPSGRGYLNAAQIYPYVAGTLYRLYAAPERVSEIALEPGETLVSVAAGDTIRWVIGDTSSGSGRTKRTHILVKPTAAGLRTNLVIATDRRIYHVQLESTTRSAMASIAWSYPGDGLMAVRYAEAAALPSPAEGVAPDALDFGYRIDGDQPRWRPLRAFDDGRQVFIEFPPDIVAREAPPLFVLDASGGPEIVNYRVRGRFYVVDRLFDAAELRMGAKKQQIVRIVRIAGAQGEVQRGRSRRRG